MCVLICVVSKNVHVYLLCCCTVCQRKKVVVFCVVNVLLWKWFVMRFVDDVCDDVGGC